MNRNDPAHIELDSFWPYQTVVLADQISRYTLSVVKREAGLNLSQWRVLAAVAERPGRTARDVTDITPMDKTIVSRAVRSLIDLGLIQKTPDKQDKRKLFLEATHKGRSIYTRIAAHLNRSMVEKFSNGSNPARFVEMLKSFSEKMDEVS